jgi:hypothetical protein
MCSTPRLALYVFLVARVWIQTIARSEEAVDEITDISSLPYYYRARI